MIGRLQQLAASVRFAFDEGYRAIGAPPNTVIEFPTSMPGPASVIPSSSHVRFGQPWPVVDIDKRIDNAVGSLDSRHDLSGRLLRMILRSEMRRRMVVESHRGGFVIDAVRSEATSLVPASQVRCDSATPARSRV